MCQQQLVINDIHECCKKYTVHILYNKSRIPTMLHLGCELHASYTIFRIHYCLYLYLVTCVIQNGGWTSLEDLFSPPFALFGGDNKVLPDLYCLPAILNNAR